ncbi:hypothetical protein GN244_ATG10536 [Phytophthora infestans]|uniref:Uncharacterized protein n=1 Tax=Phytophthora infestans TaxID=4787 RepID=A0A833WCJ8_PHYIN|nr:hypothetical protein GN244_ATG10536 [Phytophthora infestans]
MDLAVAYCVLRDTEGTEPSCGTVPDEQFRAKRARGRAKRDAYRERNEHAQRRGASQERSSSAARETAKDAAAKSTDDCGHGWRCCGDAGDERYPAIDGTHADEPELVCGTGGNPSAGRSTVGGSREAGRGGDDAPRDGEDRVVAVEPTGTGGGGGRDGGGPGRALPVAPVAAAQSPRERETIRHGG